MVEHPQRLLAVITRSQPLQLHTQLLRPLAPLLGSPQLRADSFDLLDQFVDTMRFSRVGGDTQPPQLVALGCRYTPRPEQQQIRLEAEQTLHIDLAITPY
ncbi:hypothetical protein D3C77_496700 [compost metagenome]